MKRTILLSVFAVCCSAITVVGQTKDIENSTIEKKLNVIQSKQVELDKKLQKLSATSSKSKHDIQTLLQRNEALRENIDSLKMVCENLEKVRATDRVSINEKIQDTNNAVASNRSSVENRTLWGGVIITILLLALSVTSYYLTKRIRQVTSSIDEVHKAQDALLSAQTKMQEESVKLDNKLIELFEKQMPSASNTTSTQIDHSLTLKVADEIVRIEMNLSRMDSSVKGYKQLSKAVQRIKDNFNANGYEIVDMLGKPYNAGMKVIANFVPDKNLSFGSQVITGIIKPQINYNGQMIQAAQITVSQNI